MHSRIGWWTEQSIEWFIRASRSCDYHEKLADRIAELLPSCRSIIEFGCGLGYEAECLAAKGYLVRAFDSNPDVIRLAAERTGLDIFRCSDADQVNDHADALVCINYGHIGTRDQLESLLSHADVRLVYALSRHNGHGTDTREDRTFMVRRLIVESGLPFTETSVSLDFDQPLRSMEEARSFIEFTYLGKNADRYLEFVESTADGEYPFKFRNRKELTVFSVEKRRRNV